MAGSVTRSVVEHRTRGVVKTKIAITVDASGDLSSTACAVGFGKLVAVGYAPGTLDTGADITIKDGITGVALVTLSNAGTNPLYFRPTQALQDSAGNAVTASSIAPNVNRDIYVAGKVNVLVAQGGNATSGTLYLVVDESDIAPNKNL